MIDLDAIWTPADDLYCQFGLLLCKDIVTYEQWTSLVRVLCHHRYVYPDDRVLNETLMDVLFNRYKRKASGLMTFVMLVRHIEAHFTDKEQARMLTLLISGSDNDRQITRKSVI
jgi:hypothetical protein